MAIKFLTNSVGRLISVLFLASWLLVSQNKAVLAKTEFKFDPIQLNLAPNQTAMIKLNVSTTTNIFGADLVIKYDQTAISVDKVTPGDFWQQPQTLINRNDSTAGKIALSLFHYPAKLGDGGIVSLSLRSNGSKNSTISLDKLTIVASEKGQRVDYTAKEIVIMAVNSLPTVEPTKPPIPTALPTLAISLSPSQPPINVSATVATTTSEIQVGPTIILEQSPTPIIEPVKTSPGFVLQLIALFLLIFGTLMFFTFKKNF